MKNPLPLTNKRAILFYLLLFVGGSMHAQLNVNVDVTDETCPGYGALSISVSNANPSAPVTYKVYFLPEDNIPVWNSTNGYVPAMQDGDYLIVASQEINDNTVTGQANATINSLYVPVEFHVDNSTSACNNSSNMTVTVTAGDPSTYEILNGPVTAPPQSSNVFSNVPPGSYEIRVTDACGSGYTGTYAFFTEQTTLSLAGPFYPDTTLPSCSTMNVSYTVTSQGSGIVYPLAVQISVTPPGGGTPTQYTQNITSGNPTSLAITQEIQHYNAAYTVNMTVTDPCGTVYTSNATINQPMTASASTTIALCGAQTLTLNAAKFSPPYTVNFTSAPAGFNAASYNTSYPGPYNAGAVFGDENNPVPLGTYSATITDACGRTANCTHNITQASPPEPVADASNHDCETHLGKVNISISNFPLQAATLISAPSAYEGDLPENVSGHINPSGEFVLNNLPQGNYTFELTDSCGNSYTSVSATIPGFTPQEPEYDVRPDCVAGKGSIRISPALTSVTITSAPAGFGYPLPYNGAANMVGGRFAMDNLPPGNYSFTVNTACENGYTETVEIIPMEITSNTVTVEASCDDFDINLNYASSADAFVSFWLQKYNEDTHHWENPSDGTPYNEADGLSALNAIALTNSVLNAGFNYNGSFRIVKRQGSYASGSTGDATKECIEELETFEFFNELAITGIYNQTCVGETFDININTTGIDPHFELISKDGDTTFYLDNGTSNVFTNLDPALYVLKVTDACGEYRVEQFNVADVPPLITASVAEDRYFCDETGTNSITFNLHHQDEAVLGEVDPDIANVTYYLSQQDADQGVNAIPYQYTSGSATIYARVEWIQNPLCFGTSSFTVTVGQPIELTMPDQWALCNGQSVVISADAGHTAYEWSTGETTESITVTEPGEYTVTVTDESTCEVSKTVTAMVVNQPLITEVDVRDWTDNDNNITVMTNQTDMSGYEFSLDGINYQESPEFSDVPAGLYTVYVRDKFGCNPPDSKEVIMATYPKYFTPNGDGQNDTWRIRFATMEPGMTIKVFDRYGKTLTSFGSTDLGWDGTFNGNPLPADDYWFIITRGDGKEYKGHFSIMR